MISKGIIFIIIFDLVLDHAIREEFLSPAPSLGKPLFSGEGFILVQPDMQERCKFVTIVRGAFKTNSGKSWDFAPTSLTPFLPEHWDSPKYFKKVPINCIEIQVKGELAVKSKEISKIKQMTKCIIGQVKGKKFCKKLLFILHRQRRMCGEQWPGIIINNHSHLNHTCNASLQWFH